MDSEVEELHSWAKFFISKFEKGSGTDYIDGAIAFDREALELCPRGHPLRYASLTSLSSHLLHRCKHLGATMDLDETIELAQEGLDLCPSGHQGRPMLLSILSVCCLTRYRQFGVMEDLDNATALEQEALVLRPSGHPERLMSLTNLGIRLYTRYKRLGNVEDLLAAIIFGREALDLCLPGSPEQWMSMDNLSVILSARYQQLGAIEDLDEAIDFCRDAVDLCPPWHPSRSMSLNNLSLHLATRYRRLEAMQDLDEAILIGREAVDLRPQGHPLRSTSLNNLALYLSTRHEKLGIIADLNESIVLDREAVDLRPPGHPLRSTALINLAKCVGNRYKQLMETEDLDEAITLAGEALDLCPAGHPLRFHALQNLALFLYTRFTQSRQVEDRESLFTLYSQLVDVPQMVSFSDLSVARIWVALAEDFKHPTTPLAYETSFRLLVQYLATLPSLPQHLVLLRTLTSSLAVNAFSAFLRQHAPAHAVELLEQGRGIFWSQLARLRSPIDDVIASGPTGKTLADKFTNLTSLLRISLDSTGADQHERMFQLNADLNAVVASIRELPGFSHFLLPSLFPDLQRAASVGPVIIVNASEHSCDALVILLDRDPVHIPLQITQEGVRGLTRELHVITERAKRATVTRELASFLRKLWDQAVSPIVDFLQTMLPSQSRIWWCPTGEFSVLPLHAAGPFRKGQKSLPDLYISSYTPTLTALIRARRPGSSNSASNKTRLVAIGQAKALGASELLSVGTELANIGRCVGDHVAFTRIEGPESCTSCVAEALSKHEWVHFACHGLSNRKKPFESALALHDGHFTVERIMRCDLENPMFAYLSACHTTVGDEESPDEVIHLASAMQFAGFRSVIGTMWAVDDGHTNKITSTFYKHMVDEHGRLDHTCAAYALNETMKSVNVPLDQRILYIHLGA